MIIACSDERGKSYNRIYYVPRLIATFCKRIFYHNFSEVSVTGISTDEYIDNVAKEILTKIPMPYDINKVKNNFTMAVTPTAIVLFQELERFNKLIEMIMRTLNQLIKVR